MPSARLRTPDPATVVKSDLYCSPIPSRRCGMIRMRVLIFIVDRSGEAKKNRSLVEIGHPLHTGFAVQNEQYPGWRTSEKVFDQAAGRPGCRNVGIGRFQSPPSRTATKLGKLSAVRAW